MRLHARLKALERPIKLAANREPFRVVVSHAGESFDWAKVTVSRNRWIDGRLFELVDLHGTNEKLNAEELQAFIETFPIEG